MHSRVGNDSNSTSFESASYRDCYIGVDQVGHILAPNEVLSDSVSSQFDLEPVRSGKSTSERFNGYDVNAVTITTICIIL